MERVEAIAHRGASRDEPENTLAAFDVALAQGCDAIELDVQLTRDGTAVIWHDRTLAAAGGGRRRVHAVALAELRGLSRECQPIPTLDDVLGRYGRRVRLLLEIKARRGPGAAARHRALTVELLRLVRRHALDRDVWILCFDADVIDHAEALAPAVARVLNLKPPRRPGARLLARLPRLAALSCDVRTLQAGFGAAIRAAGTPLLVYTCNTGPTVARALDAGARGVMSDRPAWLVERLRAAGLR